VRQTGTQESTAQKLSFKWSRDGFSSAHSKEKTTLHGTTTTEKESILLRLPTEESHAQNACYA